MRGMPVPEGRGKFRASRRHRRESRREKEKKQHAIFHHRGFSAKSTGAAQRKPGEPTA